MSVPEFDGGEPALTDEVEPLCGACGGKIGIFMDRGLAWQHYVGDGLTPGEQQVYDAGHAPMVTWHLSETGRMPE